MPARRRVVVRTVIGIAAAVLLVVVGLLVPRDEPDSVEPPTAPIITPRANGWVAQDFGVGVILFRSGTARHSGRWGGRVSGVLARRSAAALWPVRRKRCFAGRRQHRGRRHRDVVEALMVRSSPPSRGWRRSSSPASRRSPCAIWAPDGRWAALAVAARCGWSTPRPPRYGSSPGYVPTDLEWRPGTDQLAITGRAVQGASWATTPRSTSTR